jgi:hypothetical protein
LLRTQVIAGCLSEEEIKGLKEHGLGQQRRGLASKGTKLSEDEVQQLMEAVRFFNHSSTNPAASHTHP